MKVAIIGWGSLIWRPGELLIASRWHKNGPALPVEFARVSRDGRLTLVIVEGVARVITLWALSAHDTVRDARENLRAREGAAPRDVASVTTDQPAETAIHEAVRKWAIENSLDAAVWTALKPRKSSGVDGVMSVSEVIDHVNSLDRDVRQRAEKYVRNTPAQIETEMRRALRLQFGWDNNTLSPVLFED